MVFDLFVTFKKVNEVKVIKFGLFLPLHLMRFSNNINVFLKYGSNF